MKGAAPRLSDERVRQMLAHAIDQRAKGVLFTTVMCSELESLAQEVLDKRTAVGVLNARCDELEHQVDVAAKIIVRMNGDAPVSKSSPKTDRVDVAEIVHAPVRK